MNRNKIYLAIGLIIIIMSGLGCVDNTLSDKERTSVPDPMMTITDTRKNLRGEDDTYRIKITNVSKIDQLDTFEMRGNIPVPKRYNPISPDHILLEVRVELFENMTKIRSTDIIKEEIWNSSLIDSDGNIYSRSNMLDIYMIPIDYDGNYSVSDITVYFSVPKNSTDFKFQYRNSSLIDIWHDYLADNK